MSGRLVPQETRFDLVIPSPRAKDEFFRVSGDHALLELLKKALDDSERLEKLQGMVGLCSGHDTGTHVHRLIVSEHYDHNQTPPKAFDLRAWIDNH